MAIATVLPVPVAILWASRYISSLRFPFHILEFVDYFGRCDFDKVYVSQHRVELGVVEPIRVFILVLVCGPVSDEALGGGGNAWIILSDPLLDELTYSIDKFQWGPLGSESGHLGGLDVFGPGDRRYVLCNATSRQCWANGFGLAV